MLDAKLINSELKIVKIDDLKFKARFGYTMQKGWAFKHPEYGFYTMCDPSKDKISPYVPQGGKKALEEILRAGGITHFENSNFVKPLENL